MFTLIYYNESNKKITYSFDTEEKIEAEFEKLKKSHPGCEYYKYYTKYGNLVEISVSVNGFVNNGFIISKL